MVRVMSNPQVLLHNSPSFHRLTMERDGRRPLVVLRGFQDYEGETGVARTRIAQPYPPALGERIGMLTRMALDEHYLASSEGRPIPMADKADCAGNPMLGTTRFAMTQQTLMSGRRIEEATQGCIPASEGTYPDEEDCNADGARDMVPDGGGCVRGLEPWQHIEWTIYCENPFKQPPTCENMPSEWWNALHFEADNSEFEIDMFREEMAEMMTKKARELDHLREGWIAGTHPLIKPVAEHFHGPFIEWLVEFFAYGDTELPQNFRHGFPWFGMLGWIKDTDMEQTGVYAAPLTPQELREQRISNNLKIIRSLKEGDDQGDEVVHRQTCEEATRRHHGNTGASGNIDDGQDDFHPAIWRG